MYHDIAKHEPYINMICIMSKDKDYYYLTLPYVVFDNNWRIRNTVTDYRNEENISL